MTTTAILDCGHAPTIREGSIGVGYGKDSTTGATRCYDCCAEVERASMVETGKATLYLDRTRSEVTDWPGMLRFHALGFSASWHNMAGKNGRVDFYFRGPDGFVWHGYQIGNFNEIAHCRRTKATTF